MCGCWDHQVTRDQRLLRMREGIYWGGSHPARRRQQLGCSPSTQSFVLRSGHQARGRRGGSVLPVGCLVLCFVAWALISRLWTPAPIFSGSLPYQAGPGKSVVFDLYWYNGHESVAHNMTLSGLAGPVLRRRRRGGLQHSIGASTESTRREICDVEEEQEEEEQGEEEQSIDDGEEGIGDDILNLEFDPLIKSRKGCNNDCTSSMACSSSSTQATAPPSAARAPSPSPPTSGSMKPWPLYGGHRREKSLESLYVKIVLGPHGALRRFIMHVDSGSAHTWVNCEGSPVVGPSGLFSPEADSYLNCETSKDICDLFQDKTCIAKQPCDSAHGFRCSYAYEYADHTLAMGSVINADISFDLSDGCRVRHTIPIGCATAGHGAVNDNGMVRAAEPPSPYDGLLGLGRHPVGMLSQLYSLNLLSEYVTALCLDHARPRGPILPRGCPAPPMEYAGFLSFGDSFTSQLAATTVWTASISTRADKPQNAEPMYIGQLVGVMYRDSIVYFRSKKRKSGDNSVQVGSEHKLAFDTGADLTYLRPTLLKGVENVLDQDARRMGYEPCRDSSQHARHQSSRKCWSDPTDLSKSLVQDFGELTMQFSSLANDGTTSDLVIKPEYYITVHRQADGASQRTCFNMRQEVDYPFGNIGAEAMKGHLIIFKDRPHQIGWSPVTSCRNLR